MNFIKIIYDFAVQKSSMKLFCLWSLYIITYKSRSCLYLLEVAKNNIYSSSKKKNTPEKNF